jgi:hypothetical protein
MRIAQIVGLLGLLGLLLGTISTCGSSGDNAKVCGPIYALGCVGDGRPASTTTPGEFSTTSCASSEYTYFKLSITLANPNVISQVSSCILNIADSQGDPIEAYTLPSVEAAGGGQGCAGLTSAMIGSLSYSSCCASSETLQFTILVKDSNDAVLATGNMSGPCSKLSGSQEVAVNLRAN